MTPLLQDSFPDCFFSSFQTPPQTPYVPCSNPQYSFNVSSTQTYPRETLFISEPPPKSPPVQLQHQTWTSRLSSRANSVQKEQTVVLLEQCNAKVNRVSFHHVVLVQNAFGTRTCQVEDSRNLVLPEVLAQRTLFRLRKLNQLHVFGNVLCHSGTGGVEAVPEPRHRLRHNSQAVIRHVAAKQEPHAQLWHMEVHGPLDRCPVRLEHRVAETGNLTRGRHFHGHEGVCTGQTREKICGTLVATLP